MVLLTVVAPRVLLLLACLVVGLDAVHRLGWQTFLQQGVVGKHFLAVHQYAHGLAHPVELAVLLRHAWQLLDEFVETRPLAQVEGGGVEHHRVAPHHKAACLGAGHGGAQQHLRGLEGNVAQVERVSALHGGKANLARVVAHEGGFKSAVGPRYVAGKVPRAVAMELVEPRGVFVNVEYGDFCTGQRFTRLGIDNAPRHHVGCGAEAADQHKEEEEKRVFHDTCKKGIGQMP